MTTKDEALNLALEALESGERFRPGVPIAQRAITAIREALADQTAQQQEHMTDVVSGKTFDQFVALNESNATRVLELDELCETLQEKTYSQAMRIAELEAQLAQPAQQEPVAWKHDCAALLTNDVELWVESCPHCGKPRTLPPASKPWVGLTMKEIDEYAYGSLGRQALCCAIEIKLKEKNNG